MFLAALLLAACEGADPAAANAAAPSDALTAVRLSVETLRATADGLRLHPAVASEFRARADQLWAAVGSLEATARALEVHESLSGPGADEELRRLGQSAGQLAPILRRLKKEIASAALDPAAKQALLQSVSRTRWAAESVRATVDEYVAERPSPAVQAAREQARMVSPPADELGVRQAPLASGSAIYVIAEGHIDALDAAYEDDALGLSIHDETVVPDVEREIATTLLVVKPAAKLAVPDERFAFLGVPGAPVWILPEAQPDAEAAGILWPGLATEEIEPGIFVGDRVEFRLRRVFGPNGFSLFLSPQDESSPPTLIADSEDGLPDIVPQSIGVHQHLNWAFEAPGVYLVRVDVRGRLADVPGNPWVASATETLKFIVLP